MAYIEAHQDLPRHPKTGRAARALGIGRPQLMGHLHCLWGWAIDLAPDGDLSGLSAAEIAEAAMWDGDPDQFVAALVECRVRSDGHGFLCGADAMQLHDWEQFAGKLVASRQAASEGGARGNHVRWHAGRFEPSCRWCVDDQAKRGGDSEPEPPDSPPDSPPDRGASRPSETGRLAPYLTGAEMTEPPPARTGARDDATLPLLGEDRGATGPQPLPAIAGITADRVDDLTGRTLELLEAALPSEIIATGHWREHRRFRDAYAEIAGRIAQGWMPAELVDHVTRSGLKGVHSAAAIIASRLAPLAFVPSAAHRRDRAVLEREAAEAIEADARKAEQDRLDELTTAFAALDPDARQGYAERAAELLRIQLGQPVEPDLERALVRGTALDLFDEDRARHARHLTVVGDESRREAP